MGEEDICRGCRTTQKLHAAAAFCDACSIKRIPKCYQCPRCNRPYTRPAVLDACVECLSDEEWRWHVENWPELRKRGT